MTPAARAWLVLAAGVVGWDVCSPRGQTLSEQVDVWLIRRPWLTRAVVVVVAAHLLNLIPARADPIHALFGR